MTSRIEQPRPGRAATASNTAAAIVDMDGRHYARGSGQREGYLQGYLNKRPVFFIHECGSLSLRHRSFK